MNLRNDIRQNVQGKLDFSSEPTGEAQQAGREEAESSQAVTDIGQLALAVVRVHDLDHSIPEVAHGAANKGWIHPSGCFPRLSGENRRVGAVQGIYSAAFDSDGFVAMPGTSMAAPHIAGSAALLRQAGVRDPLAIKALLHSQRQAGFARSRFPRPP